MRSTGSINLRFFDDVDQPLSEVRRCIAVQPCAALSRECETEFTVGPDFADAVCNCLHGFRIDEDRAVANLLANTANVGRNNRAPESPGFKYWNIRRSKKCGHHQRSRLGIQPGYVLIRNVPEIEDLFDDAVLFR